MRLSFPLFSNGVGREHRLKYFLRRYLTRFVVNARAWGTGLFRDEHQFAAIDISETDVRKRGRQAYFFAEGEHYGRFFGGDIGELEPGQNAKGHLFAMVIRVRFFQRSEPIVN